MPGINLSQPIVERSAAVGGPSGRGRWIVFGVLLLTVAIWGVLRVTIVSYDKKIMALGQQVEEHKANLSGDEVNQVADIDARLLLVNEGLNKKVAPQSILTELERVVLPANYLMAFDYDNERGIVLIKGIAPGYKEVAQQLMAFKASGSFSDTKVAALTREKKDVTKSGDISAASGVSFEFEAIWSGK